MSNRKKKTVVAAALCMLIAAGGTQAAAPMVMHWKITGLSSGSPSDPVDVPNEPGVEPEPAGPSWQEFAVEHGLNAQRWDILSWGNAGLSEVPRAPYPVSNALRITLTGNSFSEVEGLHNLTHVGRSLTLNNNQLASVQGLRGLRVVSEGLSLNNNSLTNLDGLENLEHVGILYLVGNPLKNIHGVANISSMGYEEPGWDGQPSWRSGYVIMDPPGAGFEKLPVSSPLCQYVASDSAVVFMRPPASTIPYSSVCG